MNTPNQGTTNWRSGITLLEVLIAAGILVVGLTSVLAMLPAAGSLFGEASMSDRAASLASNAAADLRFRGIFPPSHFSSNHTSVYGPSTVINATAFSGNVTRTAIADPDPLNDEAAYGRAGYAAIARPLSGSGPFPPGVAVPARVTVVVFKTRAPEREEITLEKTSPPPASTPLPDGVYRITGGSIQQQEDRRKRLMPPCSWVAVQKDNTVRWFHVGSSWATYAPGGTTVSAAYVSFSDAAEAGNVIAGTVSAFTGVLKVEDHIIELE
jgi:type II secretory pathway pseudopilin PulG